MDYKHLDKKFQEYLDSPEGQKSLREYIEKLNREEEIKESQIDRFWSNYQDRLDEIIEKVISKYRSNKYRNSWYNRGIEPPESLYFFLYHVARRHGREFTQDEYQAKADAGGLMFTADIWVLGNWEFELIHGQGSAILINKHKSNI